MKASPLRFQFRAIEAVHFPAGKASNIFRGAFGLILRRNVCVPSCAEAQTCPMKGDCIYARIFEPRSQEGPSGFHDQPRPFVLRAASLDGRTFPPASVFDLEVLNFDLTIPVFDHFRMAFRELFRTGLGPGRPKVELVAAERLPEVELPLDGVPEPAEELTVSFLTPTELKSGGATLRQPQFDVLLSRARDRVSSIASLYQGQTPPFDFAGLTQRAKQVHMTRFSLREEQFHRKSTRTGQNYGMGGFLGTAQYRGDLGEFLPILRAAEWTGVGRSTAWGNGRISLGR